MVRTLYNLNDLRESKFGRPPPRHGLLLLWWFAHECVKYVDSYGHVIAQCNPTNGAFGFHRFYNRERLLPYSYLPYYGVGNLHITDSLPHYVTVKYSGRLDDSNTDRIIVSFDSRWERFDSIYVTKHLGLVSFDQNHTYCISSDLMKDIKNLSREEFLRKPNLPKPVTPPAYVTIDIPNAGRVQESRRSYPSHTPQPVQSEPCLSKKCCCVLFCVLIVLLAIIAAVIHFVLFKNK